MTMDPIFKNNTDLKIEYRKMVNDLPLLNDCGYCEKLKGRYCLNFSVNCSCASEKDVKTVLALTNQKIY